MVEAILVINIFIAFFCTFLAMPFWIRKAKQIKLVWEDMNKPGKEKNVAGSGGLIVVFGFVLGVLLYIAIKTFYFGNGGMVNSYIFALVLVVLLASIVGLVDDLFGWQKGGLSMRSRIFMVLFAAIPLMVINAGDSSMNFPLIGNVNLGIIYPLIIIPIGILGATTTFNFIAGFNGLESSQGILILSAMAYAAYATGNSWLSLIALCMVASLFGFYIFNRCPAKVFPGDVMTYSTGALIAGIAIVGNIEKIAVIFFIPYMIELFLKVIRGKFKKYSFGKPNADGSLEVPYDKIYGLEHLAIWALKKMKRGGKVHETEVVYMINAFQIIVIAIGLLFFLQ
jgi:UDP-N-acetylglucosamine--dolichyl-phosphate N-acetylglucosaminephosphotransferase